MHVNRLVIKSPQDIINALLIQDILTYSENLKNTQVQGSSN